MVDIASPTGREAEMAKFLVHRMRNAGLDTDCSLWTRAGRTPSAICAGAATASISCSPATWTRPTAGTRTISSAKVFGRRRSARDGWLWGLGANNMKSGLAAALVALEAIARSGVRLAGDVSFGGVVGEIEKAPVEEFQGVDYSGYGTGSKYLVTHGVTADYALLAEPTGLRIPSPTWAASGCASRSKARSLIPRSPTGRIPSMRSACCTRCRPISRPGRATTANATSTWASTPM